MTAASSATTTDFDAGRLERYLKQRLPDLSGPMGIRRISGGQSNPTFFLDFEHTGLVLRKQPPGQLLPSAHAIDREYRIMSALADTDVPVPVMRLFCDERSLIGTPFYIMDRLLGRVVHNSALHGFSAAERSAIYDAMNDNLARLHRVDWQRLGLADFGKPGNYFQRQINRWTRQWHSSKTGDNPDVERLIAWLPAHIPPGDETGIVHGDYRLGNLMLHPTEPRVVAVLDWELLTLGHPLADIAYNCMIYHTTPEEHNGIRGLDLAALGIPSEADYIERYRQRTGRNDSVNQFHLAFSLWRFAVILEGIAGRVLAGTAVGDDAVAVGRMSANFARHACELID